MKKNIIVICLVFFVLVLGGGALVNLFSGMNLDTPTISLNEETITPSDIIISEVKGATKYEIYVDNEYVGYTLSNEFDLEEVLGLDDDLDGGTFDVVVRAVRQTSDGNISVSEYSNSLEVSVAYG